MTEQEWLACQEPREILEFLEGMTSERKLRLFAVACSRSGWHLLTDDRSRRAIEVAERFADGDVPKGELRLAWEAAGEVTPTDHGGAARHPAWHNAHTASWMVAETGGRPSFGAWHAREIAGDAAYMVLRRDVFGNPFRPVSLDPAWRTPTVASLANAAYEEHSLPSGHLDAARLAILADALEEAGCTDRDILDHLRSPGPHVRGCWVVDLLLAKE
jgi:hypothetical protein